MPNQTLEFTLSATDAGTRLDRCLSRLIPGSSRSYLQQLIRDGRVRGNGEILLIPRYPVRSGMCVAVEMPETADPTVIAAEDFSFEILYEDADMLIINKPPDVVVHPAAGNPDGTVVNALMGRYPHWAQTMPEGSSRPGIVHRLDKDTSGCLVVAKTPDAQFKLGTEFAGHEVHKTYLAIVRGTPKARTAEISNLIGRHPVNRKKMAVVERNGKVAITRYRVLSEGVLGRTPVSLLSVDILTGRTHQIRVHLSSIGNAVLGDSTYGGEVADSPVPRQMLHAWRIVLPHPMTGAELEIKAPLPADFAAVMEQAHLTL